MDIAEANFGNDAIVETDPTHWIFPDNRMTVHDADYSRAREIDRIKRTLWRRGKGDRLLVCVHAPRKQYENDGLAVLHCVAADFAATDNFFIIDPNTHSARGGDLEVFDDPIRFWHEGIFYESPADPAEGFQPVLEKLEKRKQTG